MANQTKQCVVLPILLKSRGWRRTKSSKCVANSVSGEIWRGGEDPNKMVVDECYIIVLDEESE
jgi:hypothetical protein